MPNMSTAYALVADIGGTNTRLGIVGEKGDQPTECVKIQNADYTTFLSAANTYLNQTNISTIANICMSIAAPIEGPAIPLTNCNWVIELDEVRKVFDANISAINDFEALGFALQNLPTANVLHVSGPTAATETRKMIVGAGTGFNAATSAKPAGFGMAYSLSAECGHMTLPIEKEFEWELRNYLAQKYLRASVERVLSGQGILDVYSWVCTFYDLPYQAISGPMITEAALRGDDKACNLTVEIIASIFARVVGDLALANLPMGGIYLYGGVTRALSPWIKRCSFREIFEAKGRQTNLMRNFPIYLANEDNIGLVGCAVYASTQMNQRLC